MNRRTSTALLLAFLMIFCTVCARAEGMNLLLIGADNTAQEPCCEAVMLARVEPESADVRVMAFEGRLELKPSALADQLREITGVTADRSVTLPFSLLADLVDQLGGIGLDLTEEERLDVNRLLPAWEREIPSSGWQWLNGQQTLGFVRTGHEGHQLRVLSALLQRASETSYWDLLALAVQTMPLVETDLKLGDITGLLPMITRLSELDLRTASMPLEPAYAAETQSFLYGK